MKSFKETLKESVLPDNWLKDLMKDVKNGEGWCSIDYIQMSAEQELNKDVWNKDKEIADQVKKLGFGNLLRESKKSTIKESVSTTSKKEIAKKVKLRTMDEMANDYRRIYNSFNCNNYRQEAFDSEYLYKNYVQRSYFVDSENQMANINCSLIGEDKDVLNSLSFRIARRVRKINFPFKRSLWHMLRRKF